MDYIISKYALPMSIKGHCYIYNTQNNAFVQIAKEDYDKLRSLKRNKKKIAENPVSKERLFEQLINCKVIVEDGADNDVLLQQYYYASASSHTSSLYLTILPTTGCNFACPYCFEHKKETLFMQEQTISSLIEFIKQRCTNGKLYIDWSGGEPLLGFSIMKTILQRIKKEVYLSGFGHSIVTNGYLLNQQKIDFLKDTSLNYVQVTLDGIGEENNKSRILKHDTRGNGSFDTIIHNIHLLVRTLTETNIMIRVNVNKDNQERFLNVEQFIKNEFKDNKQIQVYPGIINEESLDGTHLSCSSMLNKDIAEFYSKLCKRGVEVSFYPKRIVSKGCGAINSNSFVIGPGGEIYKCWKDIGNPERMIGNINLKNKLTNARLLNQYLFYGNCINDKKCQDCSILPICNGGCAYYRLKNKLSNGKFEVCTRYKNPGILRNSLKQALHL